MAIHVYFYPIVSHNKSIRFSLNYPYHYSKQMGEAKLDVPVMATSDEKELMPSQQIVSNANSEEGKF